MTDNEPQLYQVERRFLPLADIEFRAAKDGDPYIRGYAAVFDTVSDDLGGFREVIRQGAFRGALDAGDDVLATVEHNPASLLGRRSNGTLALIEDTRGLRFEIKPPDTSYARDLMESMRRGDIKAASFGFMPAKNGQTWRSAGAQRIREIRSVAKLLDVSLVALPAYPDARAALRSYDAWLAEIDARHARARARLRLAGV